MKASVMLLTFWTDEDGPERLGNLKQVIGGLYKQTETAFEVIVVVDGPEDNPTLRYLQGVQRRAKFSVNLISRPKQGVRIASARNLAMEAAEAPVLIGIQDNLVPGPEFVAGHLEYHRDDFVDNLFVIALACRDLDDLSSDHRYQRGFCINQPWFDAWGRNFSVTTGAVQAIGGYDEEFDGAWGHEDVEMAYRLHQAGVPFAYALEPETVGWYLENREIPRTRRSLQRQSDIFFRKHGVRI